MSPGTRRSAAFFERFAQDDLLQIRNDLMTVYREVRTGGRRLFPLRYARVTPRQDASRRGGPPPRSVAAPQVPVLLIPDGPSRASVLPYDALRRSFAARGVDVLMMEHRGVGLSRLDAVGEDLPREAVTLQEVLGDLVAVLDHARVQRASIYGTGYGAHLAMLLAAAHPERVHALVLDSPLRGAEDELVAQEALRAHYWEGTIPGTSTTAAALRRLVEGGEVDGERAGPVVLAVHEHGGPAAVRDLVDLMVRGRGHLTWSSVRQVLDQGWLQNTPYVIERDLTAGIEHTELGRGFHADGGPLDPLVNAGEQSRAVPAYRGGSGDVGAAAAAVRAPTLVLSGRRDLVSPPQIARALAAQIPTARLLEIPGAGHSLLDSRSQITQIAARWSASGTGHRLPELADRLARLPATPTDQALTQGLQIALAAERLSPWRLWVESARVRRDRAQVDPRARRARRVRID